MGSCWLLMSMGESSSKWQSSHCPKHTAASSHLFIHERSSDLSLMSSPCVSAHFCFMGLEVDILSVPFLKNLHQFPMITHMVASSYIFPQGTFKHPEYHRWSVSQVKSLCAVEDFKTWGFYHTTDFGQREKRFLLLVGIISSVKNADLSLWTEQFAITSGGQVH